MRFDRERPFTAQAPSRENGTAERPQTLRCPKLKNNFSSEYAQSNAARIPNRSALPLLRSGAAGEVAACRQRAGRSAGPEVGRGVPTPPSLPLDSTHPATGKGLLAPFRPQRGCRTGKNLAASLNDFFSALHRYPLSRCGGSSPRGAGLAESVTLRFDRQRPSPLSHLALLDARFPLLSLRDIFPRRGGSLSSKGEPLA